MADSEQQSTVGLYEPKPTIKYAFQVGLQAGLVGTLVSAVQNALGSHSRGAPGLLTRTGSTIGLFAAMGATFAFTESTIANTREVDDPLNGAAGGCAAGFLSGLKKRSLPVAVMGCALMGGAVGLFDASGKLAGTESGQKRLPSIMERRATFFKQPANADGDS